MAKQAKIVTKDSLQQMLDNPNPKYVEAVVGRALSSLLARQTAEEQTHLTTEVHNGIGFTGADARSGSLTAKFWKKNGYLAAWQIERWTKKDDKGYSRLTKYHRQLNEIAVERQKWVNYNN